VPIVTNPFRGNRHSFVGASVFIVRFVSRFSGAHIFNDHSISFGVGFCATLGYPAQHTGPGMRRLRRECEPCVPRFKRIVHQRESKRIIHQARVSLSSVFGIPRLPPYGLGQQSVLPFVQVRTFQQVLCSPSVWRARPLVIGGELHTKSRPTHRAANSREFCLFSLRVSQRLWHRPQLYAQSL
jgi:hypothetical protein